MKFLLLLLAAMLSLSAWLTPVHYRPWVTYTGELLAFISLFVIATLYLKERIQIPKISLGLLLLSFVPVLQWLFGEIYFVSTALLCFCFVFRLSFLLRKEKIRLILRMRCIRDWD